MKIGILTVPFNNNYGGFLQAFALKRVLKDSGHEVLFINRKRNRSLISRLLLSFCEILDVLHIRRRQTKRISIHTDRFVQTYLTPMSKPVFSRKGMDVVNKLGIDCMIVGSDQVWRYHYAKDSIDEYFFSFLDKSIKRFSYAASFGIDSCDYPLDKIKVCSEALRVFSGISVREDSAIDLLENSFSVNKGFAQVVLDPTLLLSRKRYEEIFNLHEECFEDHLFTYFLDLDETKEQYTRLVTSKYHLELDVFKAQTEKHNDIIRPVEDWLNAIRNSKFVLTDSFHGMVFSIIFNKPFYVFVNNKRGNTRFVSLLGRLGLQNRIIQKESPVIENNLDDCIDWNVVNSKVANLQSVSLSFINKCLL
jgi:hypothetical protein